MGTKWPHPACYRAKNHMVTTQPTTAFLLYSFMLQPMSGGFSKRTIILNCPQITTSQQLWDFLRQTVCYLDTVRRTVFRWSRNSYETDMGTLSSDTDCCWEVAEGASEGQPWDPFLGFSPQSNPQVSSSEWSWRAFAVCPDILILIFHFKNSPENDTEQACSSLTLTLPQSVLWRHLWCVIVLNKIILYSGLVKSMFSITGLVHGLFPPIVLLAQQ